MDDMSMDMRLCGYELPGYEMAVIISYPTSASSFYPPSGVFARRLNNGRSFNAGLVMTFKKTIN